MVAWSTVCSSRRNDGKSLREKKETFEITISRPHGVLLLDIKKYVKDAVQGWSGGYPPDDPRQGIRVTTIKRKQNGR